MKNGITLRNNYIQKGSEIQYGETKTYTEDAIKYPKLYEKQNESGIDIEIEGKTEEEIKNLLKKDGIGVSDNGYNSPTDETSAQAKNSLTVKQTYYNSYIWSSEHFKSKELYDILFEEGGYVLASRYTLCGQYSAYFGLSIVTNSYVPFGQSLFVSDRTKLDGAPIYHIRPIVTLGPDIVITPVENPDGSSTENMHQISKK